jgi:hypothetical protein
VARSSNGHPSGISLGRALTIPSGIANDDLREVVRAIDRVHGDGRLPTIEMSMVPGLVIAPGQPIDGVFLYAPDDRGRVRARSIRIRFEAPHRGLVALHELGHFLDGCGLPGIGFSSVRHPSLSEWRQAMRRSRAWDELSQLAMNAQSDVMIRAASLLQPSELWARSYAQFVATRSGKETFREALIALRRQTPGDVYLPRQWEDDDFADVETGIDIAFRRLGWITE